MRRLLFTLIAVLACSSARAQTTNVTAVITFTNTLNGATNGQTITGNGSVRTFTNTITSSPSTLIQATNRSGWAATNAFLNIGVYKFTGVDRVSLTNTNQIIIQGSIGQALTVTLSANVGTVAYTTQTWSTVRTVSYPPGGLPLEAGRTNNASGLIEVLNDQRATNAVANGNPALSNLLDRVTAQTASNKTFRTTTNIGGLSDGQRLTNVVSLSGSNGTLTGMRLNSAFISGGTNWSGTNFALTNGVMDLATIYRANYASGFITNLTNGTLWFTYLSNGAFNGTFQQVTNGYWTNGVAASLTISNGLIYGNFYTADGTIGDYLSLGQGNTATGPSAVLLGFGNQGGDTTAAIGTANSDYSGSGNHSIVGSYNVIGTNVIGANVVGRHNTISNRAPEDIEGSGALGNYNLITNSYVYIIGDYGRSTINNQIIFSGATNQMMIYGPLALVSGATNFQTLANSTNIIRGDISFPRATVTTIANGHNTINLGTNVWVDLTGSPSAAWTLNGFTGGNRDGKWAMIRNNTGYAVDITDNGGTEPTAANRIDTPTGLTISVPTGAFMAFIYDSAASRWALQNVYGNVLTATATNAVASVMTNGVFILGAGVTNLDFVSGVTGYVSGSTVRLGVSVSSGGSSATNLFSAQFAIVNGTNVFIASGASVTGLVHYGTLTTTNINASGQVAAQSTLITNGQRFVTRLLAGTGGFATNYVLASTNTHCWINGGLTNNSFRHVVGTPPAGFIDYFGLTMTNVSGSDKPIDWSFTTNNWTFMSAYGTNAISVMTNGTAWEFSCSATLTSIVVGASSRKFP